jgi:hypothetical protein
MACSRPGPPVRLVVVLMLLAGFATGASAQSAGDPVADADLVIDGPPATWLELSLSTAAATRAHALGGVTLFGAGSPGGPAAVRVVQVSQGSGPTGGWPHFEFAGIPAGTYYVVLVYGVVTTTAAPPAAWHRLDFGQACSGPPGMSGLTPTVTGNTVTIALSASSSSTACPPDYQQVEVGTAPGLSDILSFVSPSPLFAATNVPSGDYYLRAYGVNRFGRGPTSLEMPVRVPGGTCTPPPAPANLTAAASGGVVTLAWTQPPPSGTPVAFYELQVFLGTLSTGLQMFGPPIRLPATTALSAPAPPGSYTVFVRAASPCGKSAYSSGASVVVP